MSAILATRQFQPKIVDQKTAAHQKGCREPKDYRNDQSPQRRSARRSCLPLVYQEEIENGNPGPVEAVVDHAEDQDNFQDQKRCAPVESNRFRVERGEEIDRRSVQNVNGQEQKRAQAGQAVEEKTQLPHAATVANKSIEK